MPLHNEQDFIKAIRTLGQYTFMDDSNKLEILKLAAQCVVYVLRERGQYPPENGGQVGSALRYILDLLPPLPEDLKKAFSAQNMGRDINLAINPDQKGLRLC